MENYFELFGLPMSFGIDVAAVRKKYLELSRNYHPDRFATADELMKEEVLKKSAVVNEAYKILNNADLRMAYVLKMNDVLEEEEKYNLPPAFLMEMMDLNEALDEGNEILAGKSWAEALNNWDTETQLLLHRFDSGERDIDLLKKIKDFFFQKKYLLRIKERLDTFAAS